MHELLRALGLRQLILEHLSILSQEVAIRRSRVLPGKHGMSALMISLREAEVKAEDIPVYIHQGHTEKKQPKDKNKTPTVMVHAGHIN